MFGGLITCLVLTGKKGRYRHLMSRHGTAALSERQRVSSLEASCVLFCSPSRALKIGSVWARCGCVVSGNVSLFCPLSSMRARLACRPGAGGEEPLFLAAGGGPCRGPGSLPSSAPLRSVRAPAAPVHDAFPAHRPGFHAQVPGRVVLVGRVRCLRPGVQAVLDAQRAMSGR